VNAETVTSLIRPVVTLMLVTVLCAGFILGKVSGETFGQVVVMVVAFWFGQRGMEKAEAKANEAQRAQGS